MLGWLVAWTESVVGQEHSNFDLMFVLLGDGWIRYTKALEVIKKLHKDQAQDIKIYKVKLENLQTLKDAAYKVKFWSRTPSLDDKGIDIVDGLVGRSKLHVLCNMWQLGIVHTDGWMDAWDWRTISTVVVIVSRQVLYFWDFGVLLWREDKMKTFIFLLLVVVCFVWCSGLVATREHWAGPREVRVPTCTNPGAGEEGEWYARADWCHGGWLKGGLQVAGGKAHHGIAERDAEEPERQAASWTCRRKWGSVVSWKCIMMLINNAAASSSFCPPFIDSAFW